MQKVGIVCGYGAELDKRTNEFLTSVANQIRNLKLNTVILTGCQSDPKNPLTEAEFMYRFFFKKLDNVDFIMEKEALTTLGNLFNSHLILYREGINPDEIHIFCDRIRALKVRMLSRIIFKGLQVRVNSIKRKEPLKVYFLQIPSLFYQVLGALKPRVRKEIENEKRKYFNRNR